MKLLRTIRLDRSDTAIFPLAAEPGDWAISGAFAFADGDLAALHGKDLAAFRSGFLGVPSLGWSTLAQIVEASVEDRAAAIDLLAGCLIDGFGAPDLETALAAATEEIDFAASLCEHPAGTLIAIERSDRNGAIHEAFRTLRQRDDSPQWQVIALGDADGDGELDEAIDLAALARGDDIDKGV
jgi:hypothetical protein